MDRAMKITKGGMRMQNSEWPDMYGKKDHAALMQAHREREDAKNQHVKNLINDIKSWRR